MSWPRPVGHEYRLTPEHHGDPLEWRHVKVVMRRPHQRVERMRRYATTHTRVLPGPPPDYRAARWVDPFEEDTMRAFLDEYAEVMRRRLGDRLRDMQMDVVLSDALDLFGHPAWKVLTVTIRPRP